MNPPANSLALPSIEEDEHVVIARSHCPLSGIVERNTRDLKRLVLPDPLFPSGAILEHPRRLERLLRISGDYTRNVRQCPVSASPVRVSRPPPAVEVPQECSCR